MKLTKIITRTLFLIFVGISIITLLCMIELYNGTGLTHPIWDKTYNWILLIRDIVLVSFAGSVLSNAAGVNKFEYKQRMKKTIKGGYQYGR